jgi:hypothetical protein
MVDIAVVALLGRLMINNSMGDIARIASFSQFMVNQGALW